jgi:hypothetical protein
MAILTTPVSSIVLLFDVPFKPAMSVGSMQEIDLAPFKRRFWARGRILRIRLHPPNIPREDYIVLEGPVAAVITFAGRGCGHQRCNGGNRESPHVRGGN